LTVGTLFVRTPTGWRGTVAVVIFYLALESV